MKLPKTANRRFHAAMISSAAAISFLAPQLSAPRRSDAVFCAALIGGTLLLQRLFRSGRAVRFRYEMNALLIAGCICGAGAVMAKAAAFLRYTAFCNVGTVFLAGMTFVFLCAVFEKGSD